MNTMEKPRILMSACLLGHNVRYDGQFNNTKILGSGVTVAYLIERGVKVFADTELVAVLAYVESLQLSLRGA